jgi:ribose 5-phosphate isomerase B
MAQTIVIASDHGGLELKSALVEYLLSAQQVVHDLGTMSDDSVDYPDYAAQLAKALSRGEAARGILICGTGIGMSITANKFPGVRAALVHDDFTAQMAKEHNDANILVMGGRVLDVASARSMVKIWLETPFEGGRHQRRLDKIASLEDDIRAGRI